MLWDYCSLPGVGDVQCMDRPALAMIRTTETAATPAIPVLLWSSILALATTVATVMGTIVVMGVGMDDGTMMGGTTSEGVIRERPALVSR